MRATTTTKAKKRDGEAAPKWTAATYAEIATFCGTAVDTVKRWAGQGMPRGRPYDLAAIVRWLRERGPWRAHPESTPRAGASSAAPLERYRAGRARLTELEIEEREGILVRRERVHGDLARFAAILRRAGERLQQEFGAGAHEILDSGLRDALRVADGICDDRRGK
jgi:phage terminase Nu1 subunit (DNA packaging protein)